MKSFQKISQVNPATAPAAAAPLNPATTPASATPAAPSIRESSFTEADFATAIHKFISGMNEFYAIGMIEAAMPSLVSDSVGLLTSFLVAEPGANYLQRELSLGISDAKKIDKTVSPSVDNILSSFSTRVSNKINSAFKKFSSLIKYSEDLLQDKNISADPAIVSKYKEKEHLIIRESNTETLKNYLFDLINDISNNLENINEISGTDFSIIKQFLNLKPAVNVGLDVDIDSLSENKYNLDNLPKNLVLQLSSFLKAVKNLEVLINLTSTVSSGQTSVSSVQIGGKNTSSPATAVPQTGGAKAAATPTTTPTTTPTSSSNSLSIISVSNRSNFVVDSATNSLKLSSLTSSSQPSFSLNIACSAPNLNAYDLFSMLYRSGLIKINDGSSLSSPPPSLIQALAQIRDIITNPNSNNVLLTSAKSNRTVGYVLTIAITNNLATMLKSNPGVVVFTFSTRSGSIMVKSGNNQYIFDSGISKISFNINDLIYDSSNISKRDKQNILNKLKNE